MLPVAICTTRRQEPFFWLGDTAWSLFGRNQNEIRLYFQERSAQGFNVISIGNLFPNYSMCDNAGNYPFTDSNGVPVPCPGLERKTGAVAHISHISPIGQAIPASPADSTSYSWTDGLDPTSVQHEYSDYICRQQ
ncbi:MAG: DUF4038 domain-containing protein [Gammaproteobacteria bacterium]|nr:DUF4038 domain-containing protein [Gammaproteobacteria bacterium]